MLMDQMQFIMQINDLQVNTVNGVDPSVLATKGFAIAVCRGFIIGGKIGTEF